MKRIIFYLLFCCSLLLCQMAPTSVGDVSGGGGVTSVASALATQSITNPGTVRFIQFVAPSGNTSVVRVGDSSISTTRGVPVAPGGAYQTPLPACVTGAGGECQTSTSSWYFLVQSGDKVSILLGK